VSFFNFGYHLYINPQTLNLIINNAGCYNNIFNNNVYRENDIEEIEVFSVVKK